MTGYDLLNLIFLAIAVFVFFRLRSVLGRRTGNERPPSDPYSRSPLDRSGDGDAKAKGEENVIRLPGARSEDEEPQEAEAQQGASASAPTGSPAAAGLAQIGLTDRNFDPAGFLDGAGKAHEMIVTAFAAGDRATLRQLLDEEVLRDFEAAIDDRETEGRRLDQTYVGLSKADITQAAIEGGKARITVRFVSEIVSALRAASGDVVEGSPEAVRQVIDVWTFERDTRSRDPNWKLVATGAA